MLTLKNGLCFIDGDFIKTNVIIDKDKIIEVFNNL